MWQLRIGFVTHVLPLALALLSLLPVSSKQLTTVTPDELVASTVDRLFSHGAGWPLKRFRYTGGQLPEMQVLARPPLEGDASWELEIWSLPDGARPIGWTILQMLDAGQSLTPEAALKVFEVDHVRVTIGSASPLARLISDGGPPHVTLDVDALLVVDGATYEFVAESFGKRIEYRTNGPEYTHSEESPDPMVRWMGTIRRDVEALLRESR